jgi:hypothetical protein
VRLTPGEGCIPFSCSSSEEVGMVGGTPPRPAAVTVAASVAAASPVASLASGLSSADEVAAAGAGLGAGLLGEGVVRRVVPVSDAWGDCWCVWGVWVWVWGVGGGRVVGV